MLAVAQILPELVRLVTEEFHDILLALLGNNALTEEERRALKELKDDHQLLPEAFDASGGEAQRLLLEIWNAAFPSESRTDFSDGAHWRCLGFQSSRPHTDIRAGRLGLDQLHYLSSRYPERLHRLAQEARHLDYPFACSCFNVTQILIGFFGLCDRPAMSPVPGATTAGARQLGRFARFCSMAQSTCGARAVLNELYCALVERLHETWKCMHSTGGVTIMDFPKALQEIHGINADFWRHRRIQMADLQSLRSPNRTDSLSSGQDIQCDCTSLHGSYKPPTIAGSIQVDQGRKPWGERGPFAKPLGDIDLDSIFANLGIIDEDLLSLGNMLPSGKPECQPTAVEEDLNACLDRCLTVPTSRVGSFSC